MWLLHLGDLPSLADWRTCLNRHLSFISYGWQNVIWKTALVKCQTWFFQVNTESRIYTYLNGWFKKKNIYIYHNSPKVSKIIIKHMFSIDCAPSLHFYSIPRFLIIRLFPKTQDVLSFRSWPPFPPLSTPWASLAIALEHQFEDLIGWKQHHLQH